MKKKTVASFIEESVAGGGRLISVPDMILTIRTTLPDIEHTDDELAQLVATIAISRRCNLSFSRIS